MFVLHLGTHEVCYLVNFIRKTSRKKAMFLLINYQVCKRWSFIDLIHIDILYADQLLCFNVKNLSYIQYPIIPTFNQNSAKIIKATSFR